MGLAEVKQAVEVLNAICDRIELEKDHLCELDAALGDGDHGVSMAKSFGAVRAMLAGLEATDLGVVLNAVGMTLISEVGGAMGPLFGTAFLRAGRVVAGRDTVTSEDIAQMLAAAEAGIVQRGKAKPGDKTMLDAIHPAAEVARQAAAEGADLFQVLEVAAAAAERGVEATKPMVARVGRASRLGERTIGHQDAGATSVAIILRTAADTVRSGD